MDASTVAKKAIARLERDVELYQREIEDIKARRESEQDKYMQSHLDRLLLESQKALTNALMQISKYESNH